MYRHRIQIMKFVPSPPNDGHQIRVLQQPKMFRHRLPRHIHANAKLAQRLPVIRLQPVQQFPPGRIRQRLEHLVHKKLYATFWLHVKKKPLCTPLSPQRYNSWLTRLASVVS